MPETDDATSSRGDEQETKYSPAGFKAPEPELENEEVVCAGCGEVGPVDGMGVTADEKTKTEDGVVVALTRYYLHNDQDCMMAFVGAGDGE